MIQISLISSLLFSLFLFGTSAFAGSVPTHRVSVDRVAGPSFITSPTTRFVVEGSTVYFNGMIAVQGFILTANSKSMQASVFASGVTKSVSDSRHVDVSTGGTTTFKPLVEESTSARAELGKVSGMSVGRANSGPSGGNIRKTRWTSV